MNRNVESTHWSLVAIYFVCGCTAAFHVGKIPAALPVLSAEFSLTLVGSGWVVALFSMLSAALGLFVGILAAQLERRVLLLGFFLAAGASIVASYSHTVVLLLLMRALEGFGWILVAIAMPLLLTRVATTQDRPLVLGIWGAFMPVGIGLSLLAAPMLLEWIQWRGLWRLTGLASLLAGVLLLFASQGHENSSPTKINVNDVLAVVSNPLVWMMFGCFLLYSAQFMAVTAFLPTLLIENYAADLNLAARVTTLVVLVNLIGNVSAGYLMRRGWPAARLLLIALVLTGISGIVLFGVASDTAMVIISAMLFSAAGGLIPGTLFALSPQAAGSPHRAAIVIGLVLQAAGVGQLLGPPVLAGTVQAIQSWSGGGFFVAVLCALGIVFYPLMRRYAS